MACTSNPSHFDARPRVPMTRGLVAVAVFLSIWPPQVWPRASVQVETLTVVQTVSGIRLPIDTRVWRSASTSWTAVILGAETQHNGASLASGTLLLFDEHEKLRVVHPQLSQGNSSWRLFDEQGSELLYQ